MVELRQPAPSRAAPIRPALPRQVALLGGTTTWDECVLALRYLLAPGRLVQGPALAAYERAFAARIGVRYAYSLCAARVGLYGLLQCLGVGPGDEVLLQAPTHIVVANAIRYVGARPVYVDCDLDSYNLDLVHAARLVTPRTRVLLLQHTFGIPVDLDGALALARRHGLVVLEDCVHALGATYAGRPVGSFGQAAFFSTEETKIISTTMGGVVTTDDPDLAARFAAFRDRCPWPSPVLTWRYVLKLVVYHLLMQPHAHYYARALYERLGRRLPLPRPTSQPELRGERPADYARRFSAAQAALGLRQLARLDANLAHRRTVAARYAAWLRDTGQRVPRAPDGAEPAWVRYPVWVVDRATAVRRLAPHAVAGTWFTSVLEEAVAPSYGNYPPGACPRAEAAAEHLVNLPTHPRVTARDVAAMTAALADALPSVAQVAP